MISRGIYYNRKLINNLKIFLQIHRSASSSESEHFLKYVPELKLGKSGDDKIDFELLSKKILLLYFSAGWCVKCKEFTPKLKKFYNITKDDVAILWISRDKSETDREKYYMNSLDSEWMYVPLGKPTREFLKIYKLGGLPSLKLINNMNGELIEEEVKGEIEAHFENPSILIDRWKKLLHM